MDLVLRAGRDDHLVVEHLCAPAAAGLWAPRQIPVGTLVADAAVAAARPALRKTAEAAGLPYVIDPNTTLLQDVQDPQLPWARLPFALPEKLTPSDLAHAEVQDELIERTVDFQLTHGASAIVPPYLYLEKRGGGWHELSLSLLKRTGRYLDRQMIGLPVIPVFAASLREFGPRSSWSKGLDAFLAETRELNTTYVALSMSWSEQSKGTYAALSLLLTAIGHAANAGPVVAWRQGLYGAAAVAAGAAAYETGAGRAESCHYPAFAANRRPRPESAPDRENGPRSSAFVYLAPFGRSVPRAAARVLLEDPKLRGALLCLDPACCPEGVTSMVSRWREHAVRARARELAAINDMPTSATWRLNKIARDAERALGDARLANEVLQAAGLTQRLPEQTFRDLHRVAGELRRAGGSQVA